MELFSSMQLNFTIEMNHEPLRCKTSFDVI